MREGSNNDKSFGGGASNNVIGGGLLIGVNSGKGRLQDMLLTPNGGASNISESPIFETSFGNMRGRKD